jgi:imidazolonepropionase-like amidohydrolase
LRKIFRLWVIISFVSLVTFGAIFGSGHLAETHEEAKNQILFTNVHVFNSTTGLMSEAQDILIEGDRIKKVGKTDVVPRTIKRIDCSGKYAIPGLWDCHTHLAFLTTFGENQPHKGLEDFVRNGITQARDVGGPIDAIRRMKERISNGEILGPEIFYTGPMLEKAPLHWQAFNKDHPGFTVAINTKEDADKMISQLVEKNACMVKTFNKMDLEVYTHLVDLADKNRLKVVHDPGSPLFHMVPMDKAIDLGVTSIEHGKSPWPIVLTDELQKRHDELLTENASQEERETFSGIVFDAGIQSVSMDKLQKLIDKMRTNNVYFCPTLQVFDQRSELPRPEGVTEEVYAKRNERRKAMVEVGNLFTKEIYRNKVRILVGQDGILPEGTFREMRVLKTIGLSESEIIKGATIYPAAWMGVEDRLGSISPGKQANIVVLDKNPLDDIDNIKSTSLVVMNGKIISD